jgi:hypothetical protein
MERADMTERTIRMTVIREPGKARSLIRAAPNTLAAFSVGDLSFECGNCGTMLLKNMRPSEVAQMVVQCGACLAYNVPAVE